MVIYLNDRDTRTDVRLAIIGFVSGKIPDVNFGLALVGSSDLRASLTGSNRVAPLTRIRRGP